MGSNSETTIIRYGDAADCMSNVKANTQAVSLFVSLGHRENRCSGF